MHCRFLALAVKARLRVGQVLTGQDDLFLHNHRLAVALQETLGAKRHGRVAQLSRTGFGAFIDHANFQRGRASQNVFRLGRVLHAWKLHHDAVGALLLNHRFGHAEFVDAVVQGGDVLLDRLLLHASCCHRVDGGAEFEVGAVWGAGGLQIGKLVLDHALG